MSRSDSSTEYLVVPLPHPLESFRSVRSDPPFLAVLRHLEKATGLALGFPDVALGTADFEELKFQTLRWIACRARLGLPVLEFAFLSAQGDTAPMINSKLRPGDALVAVGVAP
jgi:hypothetical protein